MDIWSFIENIFTLNSKGYYTCNLLCIFALDLKYQAKIKDCDAKISMIPRDLIRYLQPLDVSIIRPFKAELRKEYTEYCMELEEINSKVLQDDLIN